MESILQKNHVQLKNLLLCAELQEGTNANLRDLKNHQRNNKRAIYHPSSILQLALKILFAAYSPVFDDLLLYDDDDDDENEQKEECSPLPPSHSYGLNFDSQRLDEDEEDSMKTVNLYNIHPNAFSAIYDIFLGVGSDVRVDDTFVGWVFLNAHVSPRTVGAVQCGGCAEGKKVSRKIMIPLSRNNRVLSETWKAFFGRAWLWKFS